MDWKQANRQTDEMCRALFGEDGPGAAVYVERDGEALFEKGYGRADLATGARADGDTFFNIASCSKQFTAVAVLQLAEKGLLRLTDPVKKFFPEFEAEFWNRITIAHLLSHSSGVPDGRGYLTHEQLLRCDDDLSVEFMRTLDHLNFEPGTAYEYMNPTFTLCGHLIERVAGQPFADYMRENVFLPAGMERTLYFDPEHAEEIPNRAHGYENESGAWELYEYGQETCFATRPDGGIYTSIHEFACWERALRENKLLSAQSLASAHSPITRVTGSPYSDYQNRENTWYGYGWFVEMEIPGQTAKTVYHTGDNGGFKILTARYPDCKGLILVFAARSDWDRYAVKTRLEEIYGMRRM